MADKHIITVGCEFQSDCIEYKDISYLKIMPICAIHELSIACHDKVNKCKYYKLYKQLKAKEQECEELKEWREANQPTGICETCTVKSVEDMYKYKKALDEIENVADDYNRVEKTSQYYRDGFDEIQDIINKTKGEINEES